MNTNFNESASFPEDKGFGSKKESLKWRRSKKRNFRGWGSVELIEFLTFVGKDTEEPLKQWDIHNIIENYIQENNLLQPNKRKKTVLCDERLFYLFGKKKVKLNKIYSLLENHFASNGDFSDGSLFGSEEDFDLVDGKRFRQTTYGNVPRNKAENDSEARKGCYASMIDQNIKLVYLRRSLIKEFLGIPETFERKVVGCFVRVKCDPKDLDYSLNKVHQLGLVTAVKKVQKVYMVGEVSTDIVLSVSNIWKDVYISMLSDDDFEEEECEDLRQLVKKGLFKRPTVAELEEKVRSIHEDVMSHWIKREIGVLQKQIDRANEKGWKREKFEYIERRALLQTNAEQIRLMKQIPEVSADVQDSVDNSNFQINFQGKGKKTASCEEAAEEGNGAAIHEKVRKYEEVDVPKSSKMKKSCDDIVVIDINSDDEPPESGLGDYPKEVIYVDAAEGLVRTKRSEICDTLGKTPEPLCEHKQIWYYIDPCGKEQGPFAMASLRHWKGEGFFDDDFRVWREGQSQADAILLTEALLLTNMKGEQNLDQKILFSDFF